MKTSELTGAQLDWAVQQCEGQRTDIDFAWWTEDYTPSTNWAQGGPIIGRERINVSVAATAPWMAWFYDGVEMIWLTDGPTPLIAAMRCYVASELGDDVDVPVELIKGE